MHKLIPTLLLLLLCLAAVAPSAFAKTCALTISGDDAMKYDKTELAVAASCTEVKLTLTHSGKLPAKAMGHDWVLTRTADFDGVTKEAIKAGMANDFVPPNDPRVIAHTKVIGGGESTTVEIPVARIKAGTDYSFFCSFPGHAGIMKGTVKLGA